MRDVLTATIAVIRARMGYNGFRQLSDFSEASAPQKALRLSNIILANISQGDDSVRYVVLSVLFGRAITSSKSLYLYEVKAFLECAYSDPKSKVLDPDFILYLKSIADTVKGKSNG